MKISLPRFIWLAALTLLLPILTVCADVPAPTLTGAWYGTNRFGGIIYEEIKTHRVSAQPVVTDLTIAPDGTVTGHVGGAKFQDCVVQANRGWLGRMLNIETDFIIRGNLIGSVVPGSEGGSHVITAPFNFKNGHIDGTLFNVSSPFIYPYPILPLRVFPAKVKP